MHGNVWEWCQDGWEAKFYEPQIRDKPRAPADDPAHVIRGGCFMSRLALQRSAVRTSQNTDGRNINLGFCEVRAVEEP